MTNTPTRAEAIAALTGPGGAFELQTLDDGFTPPLRVYGQGHATLREVLIGLRDHGGREFLVYEDERITYADFCGRVARIALWLRERGGVTQGDRVGICMRNYPEWAIAFFACQALGAIAVTLNAWWTGRELVYGLSDSGSRVAIFDDERLARFAPHRSELPDLQLLIARDVAPPADVTAWQAALDAFAGVDELPSATVAADDVATIMYTSGTTGFPKGAQQTHRNHVTNIRNGLFAGALAQALLPATPATPDEMSATGRDTTTSVGSSTAPDSAVSSPPQPCSLQTFPLFHIGGLSGLYITAVSGGRLVLMYKWDTGQAIELIERERVQGCSAVPTLVRQLLEHPRAQTGALDSLAGISSGGAPVPPELIRQIGSRFAARVAPGNGYGATETTSARHQHRLGECGHRQQRRRLSGAA